MPSKVDTSYRNWSVATLEAVRTSILTQLKAVEGTGQSHSANGRQTALVSFEQLMDRLSSIESALRWKEQAANAGNNGYASLYANFNTAANANGTN